MSNRQPRGVSRRHFATSEKVSYCDWPVLSLMLTITLTFVSLKSSGTVQEILPVLLIVMSAGALLSSNSTPPCFDTTSIAYS